MQNFKVIDTAYFGPLHVPLANPIVRGIKIEFAIEDCVNKLGFQ